MIIDELVLRGPNERFLIDSYDNQIIDEIEYDGNKYHFAKQKDLEGETYVETENAVAEPMRTLSIEGNTFQQTYEGYNLFDQEWLLNNSAFSKEEYEGFDCIKATSTGRINLDFPAFIESGKTVSMSLDCANPNGTIDFYTYLLYDDGTTSSALASRTSTTASTEFTHKTKTITTDKNVVGLQFRFYGSYPAFYFKDIVLNIGSEKPYEPYVGGIASPNCGHQVGSPASEIITPHTPYEYLAPPSNSEYRYMLCSTEQTVLPEQGKTYKVWVDKEAFEGISSEFEYVEIYIGKTQDVVMNGSDSEGNYARPLLVKTPDYCDYYTEEIDFDFYIGVGNTYTGIPVDDDYTYWRVLYSYEPVRMQTSPYESTFVDIPAYPQEIETAKEPKVAIRGTNLFDIDNPLFVYPNQYSITQKLTPKIENGIIYSGGRRGYSDGAFICIKTDKKSVYTISYKTDFDEATHTDRQVRCVKFNTYENGIMVSPSYTGYTKIEKGEFSIQLPSAGYEYIGISWAGMTLHGIEITDLQIENVSGETLQFDFSKVTPFSGTLTWVSKVTPNSVTITSTDAQSNFNGYTDIRTKLGVLCPQLEIGKKYMLNFDNDQQEYCNSIIYNAGATWSKYQVKEMTQSMLNSNVVLYGYRFEANGKTGDVTISNMTMTEVKDPSEYVPFSAYDTIEIPPSVILEDGTELELGFEKLGNYANKLVVDRVNNKVEYVRNCRTIKYVTQWADVANFDKTEDVQQFNMAFPNSLRNQSKDIAKCSHLPYNHSCYSGTQIGFTLLDSTGTSSSTYVVPRSILIPFGFVAGTKSTYRPAFQAWLQDQNEKGTPFTVCAVVEPQTFELTNTEIGQKLLEVAKTGKGKNVVEITSKLPVSKTELSYWRQIIPNEPI